MDISKEKKVELYNIQKIFLSGSSLDTLIFHQIYWNQIIAVAAQLLGSSCLLDTFIFNQIFWKHIYSCVTWLLVADSFFVAKLRLIKGIHVFA